jgi:hypothetical protein
LLDGKFRLGSRVLELSDVNEAENAVDFKDIGTGTQAEFSIKQDNTADIVMDGTTYTVFANASADCIILQETTDDADGKADLWTENGVQIKLDPDAADHILFTEPAQADSGQQRYIGVEFAWDQEGQEYYIKAISNNGDLEMVALDSSDDHLQGYTSYGTFVEQAGVGKDADELTLVIPNEELVAEVFLTNNDDIEYALEEEDSE